MMEESIIQTGGNFLKTKSDDFREMRVRVRDLLDPIKNPLGVIKKPLACLGHINTYLH